MSHHKAFRVLQHRLDCGWAQSGSVCRKDRIDRRVLLNLLPYGLLDIKLFNNGFDNEIRVGDTIFIVGVCRNAGEHIVNGIFGAQQPGLGEFLGIGADMFHATLKKLFAAVHQFHRVSGDRKLQRCGMPHGA